MELFFASGQTCRAHWFCAGHRCAGAHQLINFLQGGQRKYLMIRQHQHPVHHAAWKQQIGAVAGKLKQACLIQHVVVVAGQRACRVGFFTLPYVGDVVAIIVADVRHKTALLQQKVTPVHIRNNRCCRHVPPGNLGVKMSARKILLSGYAHFLGGAGKRMNKGKVQPGAGFMIETGAHRLPEYIFPVWPDGSERFGSHTLLAVDVRGACRLFHEEPVFRFGTVRRRHPKLAHGHIAQSQVADTVQRTRVGATRFGMYQHATFVCHVSKMSVVVFRHTFRNGLPEIRQKTVGRIAGFNNLAGNDRKIGKRIVPTLF